MLDDFTPDHIQRELPISIVGRSVQTYAQIGSTNDELKRQARAGHAEGLLVLAEEQTAGRGRMGRGWAAPPGENLLMSLLLRPTWLPASEAFALTMLAGVALCEAIEQLLPIQAALKWPNDLLLPVRTAAGPALRKAAGILSELELDRDQQIAWVVIGMGVNVNWAPTGIVDGRDLAQVATSVGAAAGQPIDRLALLRALLVRLDRRYAMLRQSDPAELFDAGRERLALLGQPVLIRLHDRELHGIAEAVEPSGALRVRDADGILHSILAGDVGS